MAARIRAGLVRLAPDAQLSDGASRRRALAAAAVPMRPVSRPFGRTLFSEGRLVPVELQVTANRRAW